RPTAATARRRTRTVARPSARPAARSREPEEDEGGDGTVNRLRPDLDWMLEDLVATVPGTRQVMVLSGDGLRMAHRGADEAFADRLAAACAGVQSLSAAIAQMHPEASREVRLVVIESAGG